MRSISIALKFIILFLLAAPAIIAADTIVTVGGDGSSGFSSDNIAAVASALNNPSGVALDGSGNLLIADRDNHRIRRIDAVTGLISTIAGNGTPEFAGDTNAAVDASLNGPSGIAVDSSGNIYIADTANHRIRKIASGSVNITTIAGNGTATFAGDGLSATLASLKSPTGVAVDSSGNIYIADTGNNRVRKVDAISGVISTVAGDGTAGAGGDGFAAALAQLNGPAGVAVDGTGVVYIADSLNHRVRAVDAAQVISTLAGNGTAALTGDGSAANAASLSNPRGLTVDGNANVYIADTGNHRIRKVDAISKIIDTVIGTSAGFSGDGGDALMARLNAPAGVVRDASANLYVADQANQRIRKAGPAPSPITIDAVTALPNPVRAFSLAAFSVQAAHAQSKPLTYSWNFGDSSALASGQTVNHAYATQDNFTATVTVSDGLQSLSQSLQIAVLAPNSGAAGELNVSNGKMVTNPVDQVTILVPESNGGVLNFDSSTTLSAVSGRAAATFRYSINDGSGPSKSIKNKAVANQYKNTGIFITTSEVIDPVTQQSMGKVRKTIAISARETGAPLPGVKKPVSNDISGISIKGKFVLNASGRADLLTFIGKIELPEGMNASVDQRFGISVGNVIDTVTINSKGKGTTGNFISGLKMTYPSSARKSPILLAQQSAKVSFKLSGLGLTSVGFDTEGVSKANIAAKAKKGTPLSVQVLFTIAGETYEQIVPVTFAIPGNGDFGNMAGRKEQ